MREIKIDRLRICPPTIEIPKDDPFRDDLFERRVYGESLTNLFRRADESLVVAIDAKWGDGKTTFARMWRASLRKEGLDCIYFDAYRHDHMADPFIAFCAEISVFVEAHREENGALEEKKRSFLKKAGSLGAKLGNYGGRLLLQSAAHRLLGDSDISGLKDSITDIIDEASKVFGEVTEKAITEYVEKLTAEEEFREQLCQIGKAIRDKDGFPLVIVIDELDRCRPDFALALLERVKHYFEVENVSFLFLVNMGQLNNSVAAQYGNDIDARIYLQKFFSITSKLPRNEPYQSKDDYTGLTRKLMEIHGIKHPLDDLLPELFERLGFTLREVERCFSLLSLYFAQLPKNRFFLPLIIPCLAVLRIRYPDEFARLSRSDLNYEELEELLRLRHGIRNKDICHSVKSLEQLLKLGLYSDVKLSADQLNDTNKLSYFTNGLKMERALVIPFFCSEFSMFTRDAS